MLRRTGPAAANVRAQASWWSEPGAAARSASAGQLGRAGSSPPAAQAGSAKRSSALRTLAWSDCTTPISDSALTPASTSAT